MKKVSLLKLLYLVTEDWYFVSHRLELARAARAAGYDVAVATRVRAAADKIEAAGIRVLPLRWRRREPWAGSHLLALWEIVRLYRRERPDLVHHVSLKAVVFGTIAARLTGVRNVVNAVNGLGYAFTSSGLRARFIRLWLRGLLGWLLSYAAPNNRIIVQNPDDQAAVHAIGARPECVVVIHGSGIDLSAYPALDQPFDPPVTCAVVSRMLWDKGIRECVEAARLLAARGISVRWKLFGWPDPQNRAAIPRAQLDEWSRDGVVEWMGYTEDIISIWASAHIAVLPSYREGLPKALIEAASCGRALVATDVPGCREVVIQGSNGLLVPARDPARLADAIQALAGDAQLRESMGRASRRLAESRFALRHIVNQTLALYRAVLNGAG